jgi:myo-inositol 2-dehydrogenase/D-chiro-inositol 1-dehydrogenase
MPARPLRLGFIGCGSVVERFHLPALRRVAGIEVAALADLDPARCRALADRFGVSRCQADASSLIGSDVGAVAVCVPPEDHARIGLEVLRAGKHLFLEKPIALSMEDADALVETAGRCPVVAMSGFNLRGHRLAREARRLIASGRLGRVRSARSAFSQASRPAAGHWRALPGRGGHALLDLGVHHFDLLRFVLHAEFEEIDADSSPDGARTSVAALLSGGVRAEIRLCAAEGAEEVNELELETENGRLTISFYRTLGLGGRPLGFRRLAEMTPGLLADRWKGGAYPSSYRRQWREFARAVATGARGHATLEDGRAALAVALAAAESVRAGRPVSFGSPAERPREKEAR